MRETLRRLGVGAYLLWILLGAALIVGRHTPAPSFRIVHLGVVAGAAVLALVGAAKLLRKGYRRFTRRFAERSDAA